MWKRCSEPAFLSQKKRVTTDNDGARVCGADPALDARVTQSIPSQSTPRQRPIIVLAEDDAAFRKLLAKALETDGYDIVMASTGAELIGQVNQCSDDGREVALIISDVRMPEVSGLMALKHLRNSAVTIPVILVTAFSDSFTRDAARRYGATVLDKPVKLSNLRIEVNYALGLGLEPGVP